MDGTVGRPQWYLDRGQRWKPELIESSAGSVDVVRHYRAWIGLRDDGSYICFDSANTLTGTYAVDGDCLQFIGLTRTWGMPGENDERQNRLVGALNRLTSSRTKFTTKSATELVLECTDWRIAFVPETAPSPAHSAGFDG